MADITTLNARYAVAKDAVAARGVNPTYLLTLYLQRATGLLEHECAKCPAEAAEYISVVDAMFAAVDEGAQLSLRLEE